MVKRIASHCLIAVCLLGMTALPAAARTDAELHQQRALFRAVYADAELGTWKSVEALTADEKALLRNYVLWPDLRAAWLKSNIRTRRDSEIDTFLLQYGTLRAARELRYRQALNFVRKGRLDKYLSVYEQFYQGQDIAKLDCLALQAELAAGNKRRVDRRALELWMVGHSQVKECDPVFKYLGESQILTSSHYAERFALAIEARQFSLARWLAKSIDEDHVRGCVGLATCRKQPAGIPGKSARWPGRGYIAKAARVCR